ncbi:MAG: hypothetical protein JXR78_10275 [Victivallales bacterium]|nr:hypothetical protein [Victivallales bacterium]
MKTKCPQCKQEYNVDKQHINTQTECQKCKEVFTIEEIKASSPLTPFEEESKTDSTSQSEFKSNFKANFKANFNIESGKRFLSTNPAISVVWGCLAVAILLNFLSNLLFFLWGPLYFAVFIHGFMALDKRKLVLGICLITAAVILPIIIFRMNERWHAERSFINMINSRNW